MYLLFIYTTGLLHYCLTILMGSVIEASVFKLLNQQLEKNKQKPFFWDSIIFSIAFSILGLSISSIILELLSDENSVACFTSLENESQYTYINSYCHKFIPKTEYFPLILLLQATCLIAPHYGWTVFWSSKFESFLSHEGRMEILRDKNTGKYPYHNYTIVKYLRREFDGSCIILASYIIKLYFQVIFVVGMLVTNAFLFENLLERDITFKCGDDNLLFDTVTCAYPRRLSINVLIGIDYFLIVLALLILITDVFWLLFWNHSNDYKDDKVIAQFCYDSCIDPRYYYKPPKENKYLYCITCSQKKDDFSFLRASLHSGLNRIFKTILIEDIISELSNDTSLQGLVKGN